MNIYYATHKSRRAEVAFFESFRKQFPDANYLRECYRVEEHYLQKFVHTPSLLAALALAQYLPTNQRERCKEALKKCPTWLKVARKTTSISFDIVVIDKGQTYYWEFHEDQHRKLKDNREKKIYDADTDKEITVPRCVQRLVRDIWRIQYFRPYSIVWKDWFENQTSYQPQLQTGLREDVLPSKFSFLKFYEIYSETPKQKAFFCGTKG